MLVTLIRKEVLSHVLSLRFGVTFILFILLVFASIFVTTNEFQRDREGYFAGMRMAGDRLDEIMKHKDIDERVQRLLYGGLIDPVPVPPLSSVVQGLRPATPAAFVTSAQESRNIARGTEDNPLAGLLRIPDLVYVVSVVLSLLAILFAFDSVCGEKESGTLRLTLSNAVPRHSILLAKWLGGYVVLIVPFLIAAIGGLGYAWWRGALELKLENVQRIGPLLGLACLYISVFFTLSLFVSTVTHRATTALFLCLLIWVAWILVVPNLAPVIAKIVEPTPSVEKINAEKAAVDEEILLRKQRLTLTSGKLSYGEEIKREQEKLDREGERRKDRWDSFLADAVARQTGWAETLGRLSPSACWTYSAVAITGTGPQAYNKLQQAQKKLEKDLEDLLDRLRTQRRKTGKYPTFTVDDVPHLQVVPPNLSSAVRSALNDMLILAILNVVFFMSAFMFFLRYDVR